MTGVRRRLPNWTWDLQISADPLLTLAGAESIDTEVSPPRVVRGLSTWSGAGPESCSGDLSEPLSNGEH